MIKTSMRTHHTCKFFFYKPLIRGESKSLKKIKKKMEYFIKINNKKTHDSFMSNWKGETLSFWLKFEFIVIPQYLERG